MRRLSARTLIWYLLHLIVLLVGVALALSSNTLVQGVGGSMIAAGAAGWVVYLYTNRVERIERAAAMFDDFGVRQIFDSRSVTIREEYDGRCARMKRNLDIMGFGLSSFVQDHRDDFQAWKRNANIRILIIHPAYPSADMSFANQRDREEKETAGRILADVSRLKKAVSPFLGDAENKTFGVRLYRCLPSINIFRIDDEMFWGPYLMYEQSRNAPTLLVRRGGKIFDRLMAHFETIWNDPDLSMDIADYDETPP